MTKSELASMLWKFANDDPECGKWDWDDFISVRATPELEPYRERLLQDVQPYLGNPEKQSRVEAALNEVIAELRAAA